MDGLKIIGQELNLPVLISAVVSPAGAWPSCLSASPQAP